MKIQNVQLFSINPIKCLDINEFHKTLWSLTNGTQNVNDGPEKSTE